MKVKIKVKNIILLFLVCIFIYLVIIPIGSLEIANYLNRKGSDKSTFFYESFISKAWLWNDSKALYEYATGLMGYGEKYQIFMDMSGGIQYRGIEDIEKGIRALKKVLNKNNKSRKDMDYTLLAYAKTMNAYIELQSPEDLLDWIGWGQKEDNKKINYISDLYLSFYHMVNRDYDLAGKTLDKWEGMDTLDYRYYYIRGELALWQGNLEAAKKYYDLARPNVERYMDDQSRLFASGSYAYRDYWLAQDYPNIKGDTKIRGKVEFNGRPMPFVEIYLQKKNQGMRVGGNNLVGITDINGEYETLGFDPSRYNIGIGMSGSILQDKVYQKPQLSYIDLNYTEEFDFSFVSPFNITSPKKDLLVKDKAFTLEWEEVDGADYYEIQVIHFFDGINKSGGYFSFPLVDENSNTKIKDNRATFDVEKLKESPGGFSYSGEDMRVAPSAILGPFVPESDYFFTIHAYDSRSKLINSSVGLRTFYENYLRVSLRGRLTEGERLIQALRYEEAIDYYTDLLKEDNTNQEALLYLAKIYMVGYASDKADYDKAWVYASSYDSLNKGKALRYQVIQLMDHASKRKYKEEVGEILREVSRNGQDGNNVYFYLGSYYLSIGEYELARENLDKIDYYRHQEIFYIDLYRGDIESVLNSLSSGDMIFYNIDEIQFKTALEKIDAATLESQDYDYLKSIIEKILSGDRASYNGKEEYLEVKSKIQDPNLIKLLDLIAQEKDWLAMGY